MKKGKTIIAISTIIWVCVLITTLFTNIFTNNPYINTIIFFFGMMITICGFAYGCEEIEKQKK